MEFDRDSTAIFYALVCPALSRYLYRLADRLKEAGYRGPVLIMQSHGGVAPIVEAARLAAGAVVSRPAGGVAGSRHAARVLPAGNLITLCLGSTNYEINLIVRAV